MFAQIGHFKKHNDDLILEMSKMMTELEKVGMDKALNLNPISCATLVAQLYVLIHTVFLQSDIAANIFFTARFCTATI